MDKTRKIVGVGLFLFLLSVSGIHYFDGTWRMDDIFSASFAIVSLATAFIDRPISKYIQIGMMLTGAFLIGVVDDNSKYVSILIISFAYIGAVSYGFFTRNNIGGNSLWYAIVIAIFLLSCEFDLLQTVKWCLLVSLCHVLQWAFMRNIVQRARLADILENEKLKTTLVETVEAGMILSKEIKTRGAEHAAQG